MTTDTVPAGRWEDRARSEAALVLGTANEMRVRPLSIRPGREVYACEARGRRVVAKIFPDDGRAAASARALDLLGGTHGVLTIPRCLAHRAGSAVVVQEFIDGEPVGPLLRGAGADRMVELVARAVARMHALPVTLPARVSRAQSLAAATVAAHGLDGDDGRLARSATHAAQLELEQAPVTPMVPAHGDLGWAQLLFCDPAVGVLDFDKALDAERGLDMGNLVAQLTRSRGAAGVALRDRLIAVYEAESALVIAGVADAYALLVLVRKLAWLAPARRGEVRAATELLLSCRDR